jgi:hypothetical protein
MTDIHAFRSHARSDTRIADPRLGEAAPLVTIDLSVVIVAFDGDQPLVQVVEPTGIHAGPEGLPAGAFDPMKHRTLELGLRAFAAEQARVPLGYVEQLYTFGDKDRHSVETDDARRVVSIGYLALTRLREETAEVPPQTAWRSWYQYFPWEDHRAGSNPYDAPIQAALSAWAAAAPNRLLRVRRCFGEPGQPLNEELVLERYELLYEAGLVGEAVRDRAAQGKPTRPEHELFGHAMAFDHRRILATAIGRLRGKLKYRPVVFELMPPDFTLTELQTCVEAVSGILAHKQNFRRLLESGGLVEPTGTVRADTGGRPAKAYRFRRDVVAERPAPGVNLRPGRR